MAATVEQLKSQLGQLSNQERAELAYFLITSLEPEEDEETVSKAWEAELQRRAEDIRSGRVVGKSAEQLFAELDEEYP